MEGGCCDPREEPSSSESSEYTLKPSIVRMRSSVSSSPYMNFVKVICSPLVVEANRSDWNDSVGTRSVTVVVVLIPKENIIERSWWSGFCRAESSDWWSFRLSCH